MTNQRVRSAMIGAVLVLTGVAVGGEAALAYQGHMFAARGDLQAARAQLNAGLTNKDGHRVSALNLVNQALAQTNAAIEAGAE